MMVWSEPVSQYNVRKPEGTWLNWMTYEENHLKISGAFLLSSIGLASPLLLRMPNAVDNLYAFPEVRFTFYLHELREDRIYAN